MMSKEGSTSGPNALPFAAAANWQQRRVTDQFQDDPLRNLAMSHHALAKCYTLLEKGDLLDLEALLQELQAKTRADSIVFRHMGVNMSSRATTEAEQQFIRAFYDGPLQVLSSFTMALEVCLLLLARQQLAQLDSELHHLQERMRENVATCYHWAREVGGPS